MLFFDDHVLFCYICCWIIAKLMLVYICTQNTEAMIKLWIVNKSQIIGRLMQFWRSVLCLVVRFKGYVYIYNLISCICKCEVMSGTLKWLAFSVTFLLLICINDSNIKLFLAHIVILKCWNLNNVHKTF